jgi:hypothetical protein
MRVPRRIPPFIGVLVALVPAMASAQTNLDEGKSPAQIFASDCAVCHKAARGLANGKNSLTLSGFLREHYTSSREQAAALAAYVLGAGGDSAPATQGRGQKPSSEHAKGPNEEPKPTTRQARQPGHTGEHAPATAKLQPPAEEQSKPETKPGSGEENSRGKTGRRSARSEPAAPARHGRQQEPEIGPPTLAAPEPAAPAAPKVGEAPNQDARSQDARIPDASPGSNPGSSGSPPADEQPGEGSSVPRDNIPD